MKAVVFKEPFTLSVEEVDDPRIEHPLDAVIRITTVVDFQADRLARAAKLGVTPIDLSDTDATETIMEATARSARVSAR